MTLVILSIVTREDILLSFRPISDEMTGIYVLLIGLDKPKDIQVGKRLRIHFEKGYYGYVGSALSGLERRLARHLRTQKKLHWHIDYLLNHASIREAIFAETNERKECLIAEALSRRLPSIIEFGCSDCHCDSHLFFCPDLHAIDSLVRDTFKNLNLNPVVSSPSIGDSPMQNET